MTRLEADTREHVVQPLAVWRTDVDRETDPAGDHIACTGLDVELAHGRHGSLHLQGRVADAEDLGGRLHERVLAVLHGRCSRMAGAAVEEELAARVADDARDDAERHARPLECRPLLDVQLQERRRHLLVAAERAAADAADLLAAKGHDRAATRLLDGLDRGDDPERAVELPSLRDAVEVGAHPDVATMAGATEQVAVGVDLDRQAGLAQPTRRELMRGVLLSARMRPVRPHPAADRVQLLQPLEDARHARVPP